VYLTGIKKMSKFFPIVVLLVFLALPAYPIDEVILEVEEESFSRRIVREVIEEPKTIKIEKGFVDDFTLGLVFQGTMDMQFDDDGGDLHTKYPLYFEIWTKTLMEGGRAELKTSFFPAKDTDPFDKKFAAVVGDLYYKRRYSDKHKGHSFMVGQARVPIGIDSMVGQGSVLLVKRPLISSAFGNTRALGARMQGDFGYVDYDIGGYLSTRNLQEFGDGLEMVNWVNVKPFHKQEGSVFKTLKLGGGVNFGHRKGDYTVVGVGGSWTYKKWLATFELAHADGSNAVKYNPKKAQGLYSTVGYNINDKWQLLARYDLYDPDTSKSNDLKTQYTAGVNYYVLGQRLRFSLNYLYEQNQGKKDMNGVYFMTQVQI